MAKFDHCDHRPNLEGNRTATNDTPKPLTPARNEPPTNGSHRADEAGDRGHRPPLTPPDIAIASPDIYPTGNTTEPPRDTPNHIAILLPYLPDIDTNTEPMNNYHPARD